MAATRACSNLLEGLEDESSLLLVLLFVVAEDDIVRSNVVLGGDKEYGLRSR
jgi:hypothetical protein